MRKRRQWVLGIVLGSIAVNAALGIYALLAPGFGDVEGKVLATSACVTGAGVFALACLPAWEGRRLGPVPPAGIATSILGFALIVAGIWSGARDDMFWKTVQTLLVIAGACVLASVVALARLAPRYRWAFPTTGILAALLALIIVVGIWAEPSSSWYVRMLGVVAVLLGAMALAVPILHRASRQDILPTEGADRVRYCPRCSRGVAGAAGEELSCPGCGACFVVRLIGAGPDSAG